MCESSTRGVGRYGVLAAARPKGVGIEANGEGFSQEADPVGQFRCRALSAQVEKLASEGAKCERRGGLG